MCALAPFRRRIAPSMSLQLVQDKVQTARRNTGTLAYMPRVKCISPTFPEPVYKAIAMHYTLLYPYFLSQVHT
ncbi:hypothetical protein AG1IA_01198 [Rhizoctonia solani AG-1 IA]|uniref:Uncharacterized protein n=1 Tax=Thanatephorus cucumeris (strain AG1-IA) TaxID=983506 RepID=L8X805_THACA|nr:hypothetical protein AG1IA_01198 [Rhizoctonia solani AG-1 IA]